MSRLNVQIGATSSGLKRGLDQAKGAVARFSGGVRGMMFKAFAAGAIIAGLRTISEELDRIGKLSRTGLSTDFLQDLSMQAKISGTDLETTATAIRRLTGEINSATGPSAKIAAELEALGLTVEDLKGLSPEELFERVATTIGALGDETDQMAAVTGVFGNRMADLLPLINDMYDNGGLANAPKATQESIEAAERFNDTLTRMTNQIKVYLSPAFAVIMFLFDSFARIVRATGENVGTVIVTMINAFSSLGRAIKAAFTLDRDELRAAVRAGLEEVKRGLREIGQQTSIAVDDQIGYAKRMAEAFGFSPQEAIGDFVPRAERNAAARGGGDRRERAGVRTTIDADALRAREAELKNLRREEESITKSLSRLFEAQADQRNMGVSSLAAVGGGGSANAAITDPLRRNAEKQTKLLEDIRNGIRDLEGGTLQ